MRLSFLFFIAMTICSSTFAQPCFNAGTGADGAFSATSNTTLAGGTYHFTSFSINPGVTVSATGNIPLIIRVVGDVTIEGTLSVKGGNGANGVVNVTYGGGGIGVAGGSNGGNGSYNNFNWSTNASWGDGIGGGGLGMEYGGGGGGGYGTSGTSSNNVAGGQGGSAYGNIQVLDLYGGSGGGGGAGGFGNGGGGGGAGGGAIEINCGGTFTISPSGVINANGGNGGASGTHAGGGGGGAGGSVVIRCVELVNNGSITAVGGIGGTSLSPAAGRIGGNGGSGRIAIDHELPITGTGSFNPAIGFEQGLLMEPLVQLSVTPSADVCEGSMVTLYAEGDAPAFSWSNGVIDGVAFTPEMGGWYVLTATSGGSCIAQDSILLSLIPNPPLNPIAFPTNAICQGESITLSGGADAAIFTWSNDVVDGVPFVPTVSGTYFVTASNGSICTSTESIDIIVNENPSVDLGQDIETFTPPVLLDAGSGFSNYLWNTNESGQFISVNSSGIYTVTVQDENGCSASDSIEVSVLVGLMDLYQDVFSIYPNPCVEFIQIDATNTIQSIRIRNAKGELIKEIPSSQRRIDVADLASGWYFMEVMQSDSSQYISFLRK